MRNPDIGGKALETFVTGELTRLASWSETSPRLFHYRDRDRREVNVVLERADGSIVALEVKLSATVTAADFRAIIYLRDKLGPRFLQGVVLYAGGTSLPLGDRVTALPMTELWS